jgi:hypothetical protein
MIEWLDRQIELLQTVMFNCIQAEYTRIRHALWKLTHVSMLCISLETSSSPVQQDSLVNGRLAVYVLAAF